MIVATVVQIGVLAMMNTHVYSFDGEMYLQTEQSTWDARWKNLLNQNNFKVMAVDRYMDDIRSFMKSLRPGWRWHGGHLCYTESWRLEDLRLDYPAQRDLPIPFWQQ